MRFHEFFKFENNKITEVQAIWDIPELMMQARHGQWPQALEENGVFLVHQL